MMKSMFTITLLLLCLAAVDGWAFPRECVQGVTDWPVPCCPFYKTSRCGSSENRGSCLPVLTSRTEPPPDILNDDRNLFPLFYFNWTCQCKGNFMGHNCGECVFGWKGNHCNESYTIHRKNILKLSPSKRQLLLAILHYCKTKIDSEYVILKTADRFRKRSIQFKSASYYDVMAFIYYYATKPYNFNAQENNIINFAHRSTGFLTWHRYWLLCFERQIQKCIQDETFAFPYYAWQDDPDCAVCNDNYLGGNGYDGKISIYSVFSEWRLVCAIDYPQTVCMSEDSACERPKLVRIAGYTRAVKPTEADINRCMRMTSVDTWPYDTTAQNGFRSCIEGRNQKGFEGKSTTTTIQHFFYVFVHPKYSLLHR
ncbi:tyrosinase-like [Mantella aurantiaca]